MLAMSSSYPSIYTSCRRAMLLSVSMNRDTCRTQGRHEAQQTGLRPPPPAFLQHACIWHPRWLPRWLRLCPQVIR